MRSWAIWMIRHRMAWLLRILVVLSYPVHVLAYWDEAWRDIRYTLKAVDYEESKK